MEYVALREKYAPYTNGNELLTIRPALEAIVAKIIFLLTNSLETWWLIDVSNNTIEELVKSL